MTDLISDFMEKSVKKNELEDTDDLLESSVPTRQYFCHKREGKVKAETCHNQEKKLNVVNSKDGAVQEMK